MNTEPLTRMIQSFNSKNLTLFLRSKTDKFAELAENLAEYNDERFSNFERLGEIRFDNGNRLAVITAKVTGDLSERSGKKAQYEKAKKILKEFEVYNAGFFVFYDNRGNFRFSLVYEQAEGIRKKWSNFRRFTYFVTKEQTNKTFRIRIGESSFADLNVIKEAFSVEKVNKEFYQEIAKYYYRLTGRSNCQKELALPFVSDDDSRKYEEFAVRLIGRIIFCWFLKHKKSAAGKSLVPNGILSTDAVNSNSDYYHSILEKLFFEALNTPTKERKKDILPNEEDIPFLNGGLFEPHANDYYANNPNYGLKIPNSWFLDFFSTLEQYNFTIDENSTVDAEVSVDPEMLGRVFENLLAEVVPETGETARKATGSYYTPRAIVDYMVEQSLKQYLITKTEIADEKLADLLSYEDITTDFTDAEKNSIVTALDEIKIIDPACGSGAFPMGILHRMLLTLEKIDPQLEIWQRLYIGNLDPVVRKTVEKNIKKENWAYIRKLMIIRDCIYGVDIQPIAVEIAKLRCFLSLVVDEIVIDNEENRGIEPLPNLEFKFVSANALIGLPEVAQQSAFGVTSAIEKLKKLRANYLRSYGAEKLQIEKEFRATQQKLFEENVQWAVADTLVKQLTEWNPFSYEANSWFDPIWMFGVEDGFDVVIANPPYIDSEGMINSGQGVFREMIQRSYEMTKGNWDIYVAFFEFSFKMMCTNGMLAFITPDKWISKPFGDTLRIRTFNNIFTVLKAGREVFENSNVDSIVSFFSQKSKNTLKIYEFKNKEIIFSKEVSKELVESPFAFDFLFSNHIDILTKIASFPQKISDWGNCENACGTSDAYKLVPLINDSLTDYNPNTHLKIVNTGTIGKYFPKWGIREMTYLGCKYLHPIVNRDLFLDTFNNSYGKKSVKPKIIIKGLNLLDACLDKDGYIIPGKTTLIVTNCSVLVLKLILALINSKLAFFYIKEKYPSASYNQGTSFTTTMINNFPVCKISDKVRIILINLVDQILTITKDTDYSSNPTKQAKVKELEREIDELVYQLYELTPEEIAIIEGEK
ncbi:MAG: N-6 DNA methylase [Dehalococcoidales bacterium]